MVGRVTLALLSADEMLPPVASRQSALSQWWSSPAVAERVVAWAGPLPHGATVLEPSAGGGALVRAVLERHAARAVYVEALDIDPRAVERMRDIAEPLLHLEVGDYMQRPAPSERYARAYMNPPFEGGQDGRHVAKAMSESEEVVALLRLNALAGLDRRELVWSQVGTEWWMRGLAVFSSRPSFLAAGAATGSPISDFCCVHLTRERHDARGCLVEWW